MRGLFTLGVLLAFCGPAAVHWLSFWLSPSPPPDPGPVIVGSGPEYDLRREVSRIGRAAEENKRWLDHSLSFTRGAFSCVCVGAGLLLVFLSVKIGKLESRVEGLRGQLAARGGSGGPTGDALPQ
jgi:hypothetical protein